VGVARRRTRLRRSIRPRVRALRGAFAAPGMLPFRRFKGRGRREAGGRGIHVLGARGAQLQHVRVESRRTASSRSRRERFRQVDARLRPFSTRRASADPGLLADLRAPVRAAFGEPEVDRVESLPSDGRAGTEALATGRRCPPPVRRRRCNHYLRLLFARLGVRALPEMRRPRRGGRGSEPRRADRGALLRRGGGAARAARAASGRASTAR